MEKKLTAVEYYSEKIAEILGELCNQLTEEQTLKSHYLLKQAKQMEKEQIIDAVDGHPINARNLEGNEYYDKVYGQK